ncbi:MAG TPA: discoidin domain-containing protein [Candidatus Acidoferrum sp.]|nr:discoidin domain-containing protein [Candidatus Acidoferrum sp.]
MNRNLFPPATALALIAAVRFGLAPGPARAADTLPLAGEWRFALDRNDAGTNEHWFAKELPDKIQLPGVLETQGYGDEIDIHTPWVLTLYDHFWYLRAPYAAYTNTGSVKVPFLCQPPRHYLGAAWYQRDFEIPLDWRNRRAVLFLERPHWQTTVWLDGKPAGSDLSLCTPHEYDLGLVPPGSHRLTIRVDNRMLLPYRPDAHSVSDSLGSAWNGIAGKIELRSTPPVWIDDVQVFPNPEKQSALIRVRLGNATGKAGAGTLFLPSQIAPAESGDKPADSPGPGPIAGFGKPVTWDTNGAVLELTLPLKAPDQVWDEFHPVLQELDLELTYTLFRNVPFGDRRKILFGLRDLRAAGNQFLLNGRPVYFRGTHFGGDFPLTGYPPTDVESWKNMFQTCRDWGLNHMRFHSWCPPEAAFAAADELGLYLQVECGMWNEFSPGSAMEKMLYSETGRILRAYGNHPSFVLLSASNEAHGNWKPCLTKWVRHFREEDSRRLYTPDTGWALINEPGPVTGADYLVAGRIGAERVRGESGWFGRDYRAALDGVNVPVIAHELGQWVAYPDFDVIKKFTGFLQPDNFEIFRDSARAHGLLAQNQDLAQASGRFQFACYKEEVEANLRTPGLAGFQLLDLHDYTGQGTALVGLLDPFWESKGYAAPEEFKKFCGPVVPLARLRQRIFTTADTFDVKVEAANFGEAALTNAAAGWRIVSSEGQIVAQGDWPSNAIPVGKNFALGTVAVNLSKLAAPAQYKLVVAISEGELTQPPGQNGGAPGPAGRFENDWNFWVYPALVSDAAPSNVLVSSSWADAEKKLAAGGRVLFLPHNADLHWWSPPLARVPVFWNALMGPTWGRMLGLWVDAGHPALAEFPTAAYCDWQWTELLHNTRAVNLDRLPSSLQPIVQPIDDWNRNCKLGLVFECRVGPGKLMVCSADLESSLASRPVARQLRRSLLDYLAGDQFQPAAEVPAAALRGLLFNTRIMRQLGATAEADGQNASAILDGDPNTFWQSGATTPPHTVTVHFPQPVAMTGLVLMPRQNQREHQGDIRLFKLERSDDGTNWQEIARGELASTWDPQTVRFSQTTTARYLKLTALAGFGSDTSASLAELAVLGADSQSQGAGSGNIEYQKARTASPDIDAGAELTNKPPNPSP